MQIHAPDVPDDDTSLPPGVTLPRQARSRETFERILAAAWELLAEGGTDAVTVQEVVRRAEIGVGSFYARFEDRDALILYLHHRLWEDAERWWRAFLAPERWEGFGVGEVVGEVGRVLVRTHFQREPELRAFWSRAVAHPAERIMERTAEWDAAFVESMAALLEPRADAMGHPDPGRAIRLGAFQLLSTLRGHLFFPDSVALESPLSVRDLILEVSRAYLGYLEAGPVPTSYRRLLRTAAELPPPPSSSSRPSAA